MWATRAFSCAVAVLSLSAYLSAAEIRTWTDTSGQTMQGELLEVTADGKAMIRSNGKVFPIPLSRFSTADRAYLEAQQQGESDGLENADSEEETARPKRRPRRDDLFDFREWTNSEGQTIRARYVRIHNGLIVLMQGKKGVQAPFEKLSMEDQAFLRTHLEARGEADQLPAVQPQMPDAGGSGGMPPQLAGNSAPARSSFPAPSGPSYFPPPATPAYDPTAQTSTEERKSEASEAESPRYKPEELAMSSEHRPPPMAPSFPPPETRRQIDEIREQSRQKREEMLSQNDTYICTNCNHELPQHIGAGDHCPHCRAYIAYEENEFGQKTYATNENGGQSSFRWRRRSWIGVVVAVLVGVIRFGMKALRS